MAHANAPGPWFARPDAIESPRSSDVGPCRRNARQAVAARKETTTVDHGSEAELFQAACIPDAVCGPGRDTEAHIPDEWIGVVQSERCLGFLDGGVSFAREG